MEEGEIKESYSKRSEGRKSKKIFTKLKGLLVEGGDIKKNEGNIQIPMTETLLK